MPSAAISASEHHAELGACRFLAGSSDSDSDDARRVVKSAKDRRFEELRGTTDEIRVMLTALHHLEWGHGGLL